MPCPSPALGISLWGQQPWVSCGRGFPEGPGASVGGRHDGAFSQAASGLLPCPLLESRDSRGSLLLGKGLDVVDLVGLGNLKQIKPRRVEKEKLLAP